jgi:uncharacterized protein (TIGR02391 family)
MKMFLKILWEHRPGGKHANVDASVGGIIGFTLPFNYDLKNTNRNHPNIKWALTEQEMQDALSGIEELQQDGYIQNDPHQSSPDVKLLTPKGEREANKKLSEIRLSKVDIEKLLSNEKLLDLLKDDYRNERYDTAIRTAFLHVEETVHAKAKQPASVSGHDLMVAAFAPSKGVLKHPDALTASEDQAFFFLFDGANGWLRNSTHHRTVGYNDGHQVAHILGFANLLLDLADKCQPR